MVSLLVSQPHWLNETFSAGCSPTKPEAGVLPGFGSKDKVLVCAAFGLCFSSSSTSDSVGRWPQRLWPCPTSALLCGSKRHSFKCGLVCGMPTGTEVPPARASQETGGAGRSVVVSEVTSLLIWELCSVLLAALQCRRSTAFTNAWFMVRLPCIISIFKSFYLKTSNLEDCKRLRDILWITAEFKRILQHFSLALTTGQLLLITFSQVLWQPHSSTASCRDVLEVGLGLSEEL